MATNEIPVFLIDKVTSPVGEMELLRRRGNYSLAIDGIELMNSVNHQSEDELGRIAGNLVKHLDQPRLLVGGLGLGYTVRAALDVLPKRARVEVVELVPAVVRWNRTVLGRLARHPLNDRRVTLIEADVAHVVAAATARYDAIALDVDNGPDGISDSNAELYLPEGLATLRRALAPGGVLAIWSAFDSLHFTRELQLAGFDVETENVRTWHGNGAVHTIWLCRLAS